MPVKRFCSYISPMEATMLTNTLLICVTQEALSKARQRLKARKQASAQRALPDDTTQPWQRQRRTAAKLRGGLRH